jgi:hypothetical protein
MASRTRERPDRVDEVGGIRVSHHRPPAWLMLVIIGIVSWGLYYLITYSVTKVGTFVPSSIVGPLLG